jgi:tripartite-type tricarboxylate transporter receptor subunit TctC
MNIARLVGAAVFLILCNHASWSQTARTIKIVVLYAAGGGTDVLARLLAEQIGRAQGPTIVIENRAGAGGVIGAEAVSRAAPDGNTLLIMGPELVINPHLRKVNYDPLNSFEPICYLVRTPPLIVVNSASAYRTLADLLNAARARPGELTLASDGPGTAHHIEFETLKRAADANITFVPYSGVAPAVNALLGEHVTSMIANYPGVMEQVKVGTLRALATTLRTRIDLLPDVPTVAESGYKGYESEIWLGVVAPAKTPKQTISQLTDWFTAAMEVPEVRAKLAVLGFFPVGMCGADFGAFVRKQYDEYGRVIREAKIRAQ